MITCTSSELTKYIKGKRVIIVGSGPSINDNPRGYVDDHDIVVRVNNYKLTYRSGSRTDIYYSFFGSSIRKDKKDLMADGVKFCLCKCPDAKFIESEWHEKRNKLNGIDFRYIYEARKNWWFCPTYVPTVEEFLETFRLLGNRIPTTGFSAIQEILKHKPLKINLTGFDFFESRIHNVDERWRPINPDDPIGHDPQKEKEWLIKNAKEHNIGYEKHISS